jgi:hypothetical protein
MISILIPTHKRPLLFERCIKSVLPFDFVSEIIVNNDSKDISEIKDPRISYYYNTYDDISSIYKFLFTKATQEYVMYLEDDDYLLDAFTWIKSLLVNDIIIQHYVDLDNQYWFMNTKYIKAMKDVKTKKDYVCKLFKSGFYRYFQLSQLVFKRSIVPVDKFPKGNNIFNDFKFLLNLNSEQIKLLYVNTWKQSNDDINRISSKHNTDKRFKSQYSKEEKEYRKMINEAYNNCL